MGDDDLPSGWRSKKSSSRPGMTYYIEVATGRTQWERPDGPAPSKKLRSDPAEEVGGGDEEVRVLHLLKKHRDSRRPASWRNPEITITKEEATDLVKKLREEIAGAEDVRAKFEDLAKVSVSLSLSLSLARWVSEAEVGCGSRIDRSIGTHARTHASGWSTLETRIARARKHAHALSLSLCPHPTTRRCADLGAPLPSSSPRFRSRAIAAAPSAAGTWAALGGGGCRSPLRRRASRSVRTSSRASWRPTAASTSFSESRSKNPIQSNPMHGGRGLWRGRPEGSESERIDVGGCNESASQESTVARISRKIHPWDDLSLAPGAPGAPGAPVRFPLGRRHLPLNAKKSSCDDSPPPPAQKNQKGNQKRGRPAKAAHLAEVGRPLQRQNYTGAADIFPEPEEPEEAIFFKMKLRERATRGFLRGHRGRRHQPGALPELKTGKLHEPALLRASLALFSFPRDVFGLWCRREAGTTLLGSHERRRPT